MQLTSDFSVNRGFNHRYRRFILFAAIFAAVAGITAVGFYLYRVEEKKTLEAEEKTRTLPVSWLIKYFGTDNEYDPRVGGPDGDPDGDILTNLQEFYFNTDPTNPDTDDDGQYDGAEVAVNSNPLGEGEIFSTDYSRSIADTFFEQRGLEEFREENVQRQVLGLLNPAEPDKVEIPFPDPSTLLISTDDSEAGILNYLKQMNEAGVPLQFGINYLTQILDDPQGGDAVIVLGSTYETIDQLRGIPTPVPFLHYHQLHLAALFAAAKILEVSKDLDGFADLEKQQDKIQQQYYQVQVIQKVDEFLEAEITRLAQKYQDVLKKLDEEQQQKQ